MLMVKLPSGFILCVIGAGFPSAQAEHLMMALRDVLTSSLSTSLKGCPTCSELVSTLGKYID